MKEQKSYLLALASAALPLGIVFSLSSCELVDDGVDADGEALNVQSVQAVDLGVSVKWASCNIGAKSETDVGSYIAWGETSAKKTYEWENYKYCHRTEKIELTKYASIDDAGATALSAGDDVACKALGGKWRMPTPWEFRELVDKCRWDWVEENGVTGCRLYSLVEGHEGATIFLPQSGRKVGDELWDKDSGVYWTSYLSDDSAPFAQTFRFNYPCRFVMDNGRFEGLPIRPVQDY